ncbi:hypothetical protein [Methanobacterium alcaliphilum]|uniref:hypothetical protein n=1 Tax=Methanobacterium alcaliphilum TaxID=392018 RepID=UPI00200A6C78|nr:hypothetical protein [Methanobacterium alcaliphilum]MCK9150330.1 hypothetical protein [Methanobacterium alcaliphilum]
MFEGYIKVNDKELPKTALGTAPFTAAPYFGHRSRLYQLDLYQRPENIVKIIKKSHDLGIKAIQVIPEKPIIKALKEVLNDGMELDIWGTIRKENMENDLNLLSDLNASVMFLDEWLTDKSEMSLVGDLLKQITDNGAISGLITALPMETTPKLLDSSIKDIFDIYMIPVNKIGYMMDYPIFMDKERTNLAEMLQKLDKIVMASKILAVGILNPNEALDFLKTLNYVDMVTLGIASEREAEETFGLLFKK